MFFPSYSLMNSTRERWYQSGVLEEILKQKLVFMEPKRAGEYQNILNKYYNVVDSKVQNEA